VVDIYGKSFWHSNGTTSNAYPISAVLTNLITAFAGSGLSQQPVMHCSSVATAINSSTWYQQFEIPADTAKDYDRRLAQAFINWILFDNQLTRHQQQRVRSVKGADTVKSHHNTLTISKGGYYMYIAATRVIRMCSLIIYRWFIPGPLLRQQTINPFGWRWRGSVIRRWRCNILRISTSLMRGRSWQVKNLVMVRPGTIRDTLQELWSSVRHISSNWPSCWLMADWSPYTFALDNPISYNDAWD